MNSLSQLGAVAPLIGVVHLGPLPGQPGFTTLDALVGRALEEAEALVDAGLDAVLLENWEDRSPGPFVGPDAVAALTVVTREVVAAAGRPVGVNVLPNDYRAALALVAAAGARFVEVDVLADAVRTDYSYSDAPPFEVRVDPDDLAAWRERLGAREVPLLAQVHPKHYELLAPALSLEASARRAFELGADAVVVTGAATGAAPDPAEVARLKEAAGARPVLIGSGLTVDNAAALLAAADGAIVGTALKTPDFARVDPVRARALVAAARGGEDAPPSA